MACLGNREKFTEVRVRNTGRVKVRTGLVSIGAGVRMALGWVRLAVQSLDTVLDWKAESSERSILYFKKITHEKCRLEREESKSL